MIRRAASAFVSLVVLTSTSCRFPPVSTVDRNIQFGSARADALVVFGFPEGVSVWLRPGIDDGVNWRCEPGITGLMRVRSENGFVVARLPARTGKQKYSISAFASDRAIRRTTRRGSSRTDRSRRALATNS